MTKIGEPTHCGSSKISYYNTDGELVTGVVRCYAVTDSAGECNYTARHVMADGTTVEAIRIGAATEFPAVKALAAKVAEMMGLHEDLVSTMPC